MYFHILNYIVYYGNVCCLYLSADLRGWNLFSEAACSTLMKDVGPVVHIIVTQAITEKLCKYCMVFWMVPLIPDSVIW